MNHSSNGHIKKPSYFKTLPETIATSPTGIPRISNSAFPALSLTTQYKSVYERAGFEVNKGSRSTRSVKSPLNSEPGFRSHSTSQLHQAPKVIDQKRNFSEHFTGQSIHNAHTASAPALKKSGLTIDSNLANQSYRNLSGGSRNVGTGSPLASDTTTLHQRQRTSSTTKPALASVPESATFQTFNTQPQSASSSNFLAQNGKNNSDDRLSSSQHSASGIPPTSTTSSNFAHNAVNPDNFQAYSSSQQSLQSQGSSHSLNGTPQDSVYASAHSLPHSLNSYRSLPSQRSVAGNSQPSSATSINFQIQPEQQNFDTSVNSTFVGTKSSYGNHNNDTPRIVQESISSTPMTFVDPSKNNHDPVEFDPDTSMQSTGSVKFRPDHPIYNEDIDLSVTQSPISSILGISENDNQSVASDAESIRSRVLSLSPKNQHFNFESSPVLTTASPPLHDPRLVSRPMTSSQQIPSLTVTDTDRSSEYDFESPERGQQLEDRESKVSVAASSMSGASEFSPRQVTTPYTDDYTDFNYQSKRANFSPDIPQPEESPEQHTSSPVYHEIESQLENLTMNAGVPHEPLQIKMHSVKEVNADQASQHTEAISLKPESKTFHSQGDIFPSESSPLGLGLGIGVDAEATDTAGTIGPEEFKYPPGEGPCRKCGLEIDSKPIYSRSGELSGQWHRQCFTCTTCDLKFSKKINCFVLDDLPHCEYHYHLKNNSLCKICGSGIIGKCLEDDEKDRYHIDCWQCTKCHSSIGSEYFSVNGLVFCERCASAFTSLGVGTTRVEKRRTKLSSI